MILSALVEFVRSDRARTRCFVDTCQLGDFARSTIIGVVFLPPPPPPPPTRGGSAPSSCEVVLYPFANTRANSSRRRGRTRSSTPARSPAAPIGADISQAPSP